MTIALGPFSAAERSMPLLRQSHLIGHLAAVDPLHESAGGFCQAFLF